MSRRTGQRFKLCATPCCPEVVPRAQTYCEQHGPDGWSRWKRTEEGARRSAGYGWSWRRVRNAYIAKHPTCEVCRTAPAAEVHHVDRRNPSEPGANNESNLQAVCFRCHRVVSATR